MIKSFIDKEAKLIFDGYKSKKLPDTIQRAAYKKLRILHAAASLKDLKVPPGNKLHPLHEERDGQWGISINDRYRICFIWDEKTNDAYNVEITDYH